MGVDAATAVPERGIRLLSGAVGDNGASVRNPSLTQKATLAPEAWVAFVIRTWVKPQQMAMPKTTIWSCGRICIAVTASGWVLEPLGVVATHLLEEVLWPAAALYSRARS